MPAQTMTVSTRHGPDAGQLSGQRRPAAEPVRTPDTATDEPVQTPDTTAEAAHTDEFDHLLPLLQKYAACETENAERARLREQLGTGFLPVARHIAQRFSHRGEPLEDLIQVASLGLMNAIERFDPHRGHHFLSFAVPTITGEVRRHFRDKSWSLRVPRRVKELHLDVRTASDELSQRLGRAPRPSELAEHLGTTSEHVLEALAASHSYHADSLDEVLSRDDSTTLQDRLGAADPAFDSFVHLHSVAPHLANLPRREYQILVMRFYHDMTQTQIGERLGISQMHVSRLLSATLARLREAVEQDHPVPDQAA
jgi:RNA polymerase sigma-B factor